MNPQFWRGKKVLVTGHTGFKGSWLSTLLLDAGATVFGFSLAPQTKPNLFTQLQLEKDLHSSVGDIRDRATFEKFIRSTNPEIVFHLAAQPLVLRSYQDPLETFETNVLGTANVLNSLRLAGTDVRAIVSVTTDKVYENLERETPYVESAPLGGHDPYSASKACAEIVSHSYRRSFFRANSDSRIGLATARAGNVIGGGDWSDNRLLPDLFRSYFASEPLCIRNPGSVRPWQHVLESLAGYTLLAENLWTHPERFSEAYNFGPRADDSVSVERVIEIVRTKLPRTLEVTVEESLAHEAKLLKLDSSKAEEKLGWKPRFRLREAIEKTTEWYLAQSTARKMTSDQIREYFQIRSEG